MRFLLTAFLSVLILAGAGVAAAADAPRVELHTSKGVIVIELDAGKAPRTVANFLNYVETQYYDGLIFHRVIDDTLIQSGAHTENMASYETERPIRNEAANGLKNLRGTIGMARGTDPNSADAQFFINLDDNPGFDHTARTLVDYGYCVFGRVVKGLEVADAIGDVETHEKEGRQNWPVEAVFIERAVVAR